MRLYSKTKRLSTLAMCLVLIFTSLYLPATANEVEIYDFANFTEEESMDFVEQCGIYIPEILLQLETLPAFTQGLILQIYSNDTISFSFDDIEVQHYAEDIRGAVRMYMGLGLIIPGNLADYCLQHSKVMNEDGEWRTSGGDYDQKWNDYNCYAYAINRREYPAFYSTENDYCSRLQYSPGKISGLTEWQTGAGNVYAVANIVRADLAAMGYSVDEPSTEMPQINASQELICIRLCYGEYHFMRYDFETDAWYHKPANSAILKYNYTPQEDLVWYLEGSIEGDERLMGDEDDVYNSDIFFITYSKNQINVGSTEVTTSVSIQPGKDVFYEVNFAVSGFYDIQLTSTYAFMFDIYSEDFTDEDDHKNGNVYGEDNDNSILSNSNSGNFNQSIWFEAGKYYLRMNFTSESIATSETIDVSIEVHEHSYDTCVYLNRFSHQCICNCGETKISSHYISGSHVGEDWVPCAGCGYMLDLENDIYNSIMSITQVSINGSYIRSDGIVVLVDEDIEAYLAGTLQFYHPEDVPVTQ